METTYKPDLTQWRYVPEFTRDANGNVARTGSPPSFVHTSGKTVDLVTTTNVNADMLDVEGRTDEATELRRIARGDL